MTPFRIDVPGADLDDLGERLARTRWPDQLPGDGWRRGVPVDYLRDLAGYWRSGYDWRAYEARLNGYPQFITEIDGQDIHFLHVRSAQPDAFPLILTHGWPNSVVEFLDLIGPLTGAGFDVVVPSVPGFGYSTLGYSTVGCSTPPHGTGWTTERVARTWAELMNRLGYQRYGVQGGDLGAYVAPQLAAIAPERVTGVYVIGGLGFPTEADVPGMSADERAAYAEMQGQDWMNGVDHHALLRAAPQTFAYGWQDSPVAALAWMVQKFHEFNATGEPLDRVIDRDLLLTNVSLYWFTGTSGSSSWPMYDSTGFSWPRGQRAVPTGVYSGPPGLRRLAERDNRIVHWPVDNPVSHHFVAMHRPEALAADLGTFFSGLGLPVRS
jgi:pimeloyl-ACP methyl ester carboxylesterase